jgi:hypothetical protein
LYFKVLLKRCSDEIEKLFIDGHLAESLFLDLTKYFGEDTQMLNSQQFLAMLNEFIAKFEV